MTWHADDPQGRESFKIAWLAVPYTRGRGIDVGVGPDKPFEHWIGVDSCKDVELGFCAPFRPDIRIDDAADLPFKDASQDFVFSSHLLEHLEDAGAALAEWWRVLKPGGYLCLYLPHADHYPRIGQPNANPDHKHDFVNADVVRLMHSMTTGWRLLVDEVRAHGSEYSFWQVYRKIAGPLQLEAPPTRPAKTACVVRYGGFGDMLQTANVLPALKRAGYHVTMMTTPKGQDILRHDPHVDSWLIQDDNQVPNGALWNYWRAWAPRFDRFVNLSESVEGTLLALPDRIQHQWPQAVRHKLLNRNYLEWASELAGVPYADDMRFYPSAEESLWRERFLAEDCGGEFVVLWALAGSSMHKFYPWQDSTIAQVMLNLPRARVVLVGDDACRLLEQGWELEPRVVCRSGELSIRQTLALAQVADVVVGPETGVLNSVGFERDVAKVCLLSHSSKENLTKHWKNSFPIEPVGMACYPCHQLHYDDRFCPTDEESGAAMCQRSINPDRVFEPIQRVYARWDREQSRRTA